MTELERIDVIHVDGSTALNATCIYDKRNDKYVVNRFSGKLTNNELEWYAVLLAVRYFNRTRRRTKIMDKYVIYTDSKLVESQYNDKWKCNVDKFRELKENILAECAYGFDRKNNVMANILWFRRDINRAGQHLDGLINEMKKNRGKK